LASALLAIYPDFKWEDVDFQSAQQKFPQSRVPLGYWRDDDNLIRVLDHAAEKLGIREVTHEPFFLPLANKSLIKDILGRGLVLDHSLRFEGNRITFACK